MARKNYRKIWEQHNNASLLPNVQIHHKDGNPANDSIENLIPVTLEEHINIHLEQGDIQAAFILSRNSEFEKSVTPAELQEYQRQMGRKSGINSRDNKLGFFSRTKEQWVVDSKKGALKTVENRLGIHRINADPILSRENSSKAGKKSFAKGAGFHNPELSGSNYVKDTYWWTNKITGDRKRAKESPFPLEEWERGIGKTSAFGKPKPHSKMLFWHDQHGNLKRAHTQPGPEWKRGRGSKNES